MPSPFLNGETVTRRRQTQSGTDIYGNPTYTTADTNIEGCAVAAMIGTDLDDAGRRGAVVGFTLYLPPGSDARIDDRFIVRSLECMVVGTPITHRNPMTGIERGVEVSVDRAEG